MYGSWVRVPAGSQSSEEIRSFFYALKRAEEIVMQEWKRDKLAWLSLNELQYSERSEYFREHYYTKKSNWSFYRDLGKVNAVGSRRSETKPTIQARL